MSSKRDRQGKGGRGGGISRNTILTGLILALLACLAWIRLPPKSPVSLLNNIEAKKALLELKYSLKVTQGFAQKGKRHGQHQDDVVDELEEEYNENMENMVLDKETKGENLLDKDLVSARLVEESQNGATIAEQSTSVLRIRSKYDIDPDDTERKYFVYQPSGGWGEQRMILRWALRVANAMDRTLIVPMIAPYNSNKLWQSYDRLNATDMVAADEVLDMEALEAGTVKGVRVHRDHLNTLPSLLPGTWIRNSKRSAIWLKENDIRAKWRWRKERVIFWDRGSMWECCAGGTMMTPYIMFNFAFKAFALQLTDAYFGKGVPYNAVHIRTGNRRTAQQYYEAKLIPARFETNIPIYVATSEKDKVWFSYLEQVQNFKLVFWDDITEVQPTQVRAFLSKFPTRMRDAVIGFLEQLICGRAAKWTGTDGSPISFAIDGIRHFHWLRDLYWNEKMDDKARRIYAHDGKGVLYKSIENDAEAEAAHEKFTQEEP